MDPQCKATSLFIDLVLQVDGERGKKKDHDHHRRITSEDNYRIRSSAIWFLKNFLCICDLSGFFLMYVASSFGEELRNLNSLHKINMI